MSGGGLQVTGLSMRYGALQVLDSVDLTVGLGQVQGLIGANGSGKTTFFNCVSGFVRPRGGRVMWQGKDMAGWSAPRVSNAGVVRTFQDGKVFAGMTVAEGMRVACEARRNTSASIPSDARDLLRMTGLLEASSMSAARLSYGQQRRLGVALALAVHPDVLLLDEPAVGLTPDERSELGDLLLCTAQMGVGTLIIEHDMGFLMNLVSHVSVLAAGKMIFEGTPSEVQSSDAVAEAYLGKAEDDDTGR